MIERVAVLVVRGIVRTIMISLTTAVALPHIAVLVVVAVTTTFTRGWESGLGVVVGCGLVALIWSVAHKKSFALVARVLGKWRAVVFGIWRWQRTVKGLQLDGQDGEKLRAPRVKKVRGS